MRSQTRVGGAVKEPQVISHVAPIYPLAAKEAGIYGDVVLQTTIDQKGNVVNAKVVSGPVMLRQPALAVAASAVRDAPRVGRE